MIFYCTCVTQSPRSHNCNYKVIQHSGVINDNWTRSLALLMLSKIMSDHDFLFAHIVTTPPPLPPLKKLRVAGNSPAKKLSLLLKMLRNSIRN
jgi:hypothetical protein